MSRFDRSADLINAYLLADEDEILVGQLYLLDNQMVIELLYEADKNVASLKQRCGASTVHRVEAVNTEQHALVAGPLSERFVVGLSKPLVIRVSESSMAESIAERIARALIVKEPSQTPRWPHQTPARITKLHKR